MAIRTIHKVPHDLPHARLYLDDIEEISNIFLEVAAPGIAKLKEEVKISYAIGDTKLDSIRDLQTFGGDTTSFEITVGPWGPSLAFRFFSNPQLSLSSLDEEHSWATYGKIKSVFDRRQLRLRNAIDSLPIWLKLILWCLLVFSFDLIPNKTLHWPYFLIGDIALQVMAFYVVFFRFSRVYLVRSHERTRTSSEAKKKNIREIAILVIGTVIGGLIIEGINQLVNI